MPASAQMSSLWTLTCDEGVAAREDRAVVLLAQPVARYDSRLQEYSQGRGRADHYRMAKEVTISGKKAPDSATAKKLQTAMQCSVRKAWRCNRVWL